MTEVSIAPDRPGAPAALGTGRVLLLPGWQDSGPQHWQSLWERQYGYTRVVQHDWMQPRRGDWMARLEEVILETVAGPDGDDRVVLVAHSLGCQLVAAWAAHSQQWHRVKAAFLVAPGDPEREEVRPLLPGWSPVVLQRLPFQALVLASRDDPYCTLERAHHFARAWGAGFIDCGPRGHLNADSGLADWNEGHALLVQLDRSCASTGDAPQTNGVKNTSHTRMAQ